jgi:hypothetical protein
MAVFCQLQPGIYFFAKLCERRAALPAFPGRMPWSGINWFGNSACLIYKARVAPA